MSADNTIVIMNFDNEQWRVEHIQAFDNIYWQWNAEDNTVHPNFSSPRVFEMFKDAVVFDNEPEAYKFANQLLDDYEYVEYGIQYINMILTWDEIVNKARRIIDFEIFYVKDYYEGGHRDMFLEELLETKKLLEEEINDRTENQ